MSILAVDPGITTGIAIHTNQDLYLTLVIHRHKDLWSIVDLHLPDVIVVEDFNSAGLISKDGQATLRLIGAIEAVAFRMDIPTIIQFPRERYPFIAPAKQMLLASREKFLIHQTDALSHLLLYEDRVQRGVLEKITANRRSNKVK